MVKLTPEASSAIERLQDSARRRTEAEAQLQREVVAAVAAGIPALRVAEAAGIGRTTLYRWLDRKETT